MTSNRRSVEYVKISSAYEGQRIDNFLITRFKSVPKSKIYNILRKGEVRVNKKRIQPSYKLQIGDQVRLPPLTITKGQNQPPPSQITAETLRQRIIYEDEAIIVLNKPAGMSVHAGSTVRMGVIEAMRYLYPAFPHIELAHRIDSETSGCLIIAKKKKILRELHALLREGKVQKTYWAVTKGKWLKQELNVELPLKKYYQSGGKHVVTIDRVQGKMSLTHFSPLKVYPLATLVEAKLLTGRTHQIRVHAAHQGHPIAGDDRYGSTNFNKLMRTNGLKRMFLHAYAIEFTLPSLNRTIKVSAPLDKELVAALKVLPNVRGDNESKSSNENQKH